MGGDGRCQCCALCAGEGQWEIVRAQGEASEACFDASHGCIVMQMGHLPAGLCGWIVCVDAVVAGRRLADHEIGIARGIAQGFL